VIDAIPNSDLPPSPKAAIIVKADIRDRINFIRVSFAKANNTTSKSVSPTEGSGLERVDDFNQALPFQNFNQFTNFNQFSNFNNFTNFNDFANK